VLGAVVCAVIPLLIVGWVSYLYFSQFSMSRMAAYFQRTVEYNRKIVESYLNERTSDLRLVADTHSLDYLKNSANLNQVFNLLNREGSNVTDLGVIAMSGYHLSYVGPYDLWDNDYSVTFWFKGVMEKGVYISDVFMGYREIPHFVIAILCHEGEKKWILRATIYSEFLSSLVETGGLGRTGEVFLVNQEGVYQTSPRFSGKIMEKAELPIKEFTGESGILDSDPNDPTGWFSPPSGIIDANLIKYGLMQSSPHQIVAYSWLKDPHWLLVVKQDFSEVFGDINRVNTIVLVLLHSCVLAILIVAIFATRLMVKALKRRDKEADELNRQLMQASKLASIGELAAGVAHEINNPLAVILTENQVMRDLSDEAQDLDEKFKDELMQSLTQVDAQVERCSHITQNLLRFSRRIALSSTSVDLTVAVRHVVGLLEKHASSRGVRIVVELTEGLPMLVADPFELEQVLLNLVNNAIDAHEGKPYGTIHITARRDTKRQGVIATVTDSGSGISPENLPRVFDPFFTTKPVGKGTGLGLSISYSIVRHMGGDISVRSEVGKGTEFEISLPSLDGDPVESASTARAERLKSRLAVSGR